MYGNIYIYDIASSTLYPFQKYVVMFHKEILRFKVKKNISYEIVSHDVIHSKRQFKDYKFSVMRNSFSSSSESLKDPEAGS